MRRRPPISTRTDTLLPDTTLVRSTCTGHAGHRDVVDEARAAVEHDRQALVVGGRGGQADEVDAGALGRVAEFVVMLRRQVDDDQAVDRSAEHTSDLQSLMRISYAVLCLKTKTTINKYEHA